VLLDFQGADLIGRLHSVTDRIYNVLFLCTGNSARSIMAECSISRWGRGKFRGFSAGSHPKGAVHPMTLELLRRLNYDTSALRSKSRDEFARPDSPRLDFVFTVCDKAAAEQCPLWPGQPMTAHWGAPDPAAFVGSEEQTRRFLYRVYNELDNRIKIFTSLRIEELDSLALERRLREIGRIKLPEDHD
jgi:ArsR family transcriptional regulator, arsenate/arsenite/antimonite-responsive transcriptional repressor / arsenate reductase (thioredoxin)